jgi:rhodanese-related sulfurtransferase
MVDGSGSYAGNLSAVDAWQVLAENPRAVLVDVRTTAEWLYIGVPDLKGLGREPLFVEWQQFPSMRVDPGFAQALAVRLESRGVGKDDPLLFLCRSGSRSAAAAAAMAVAGFSACFNIADGFEGPRDTAGHRSRISGWKVGGLPWVQS